MSVESVVEDSDLNEIILQESAVDTKKSEKEASKKKRRRLKRILHFSDGDLEEYSSEDEPDGPECQEMKTAAARVNPNSLTWLPWAWYQTVWMSSKVLDGCDYVGECLADFFGITAPKYQFEIDEYLRLQEIEKEEKRREDLEMGGWNKQTRNNVIESDKELL